MKLELHTFDSKIIELNTVEFPRFTGTRVMMMPVKIGDPESLPDELQHYASLFTALSNLSSHHGETGYLTIDEKYLDHGESHRRPGRHVDGIYQGSGGGWGGGWGSVGNGMITAGSEAGCRAWRGSCGGVIGQDGEADEVDVSACEEFILKSNVAYWLDGLCVHESLPAPKAHDRQFVRLSMPSNAPWFEGYSINSKGIRPTGPILPPREFM